MISKLLKKNEKGFTLMEMLIVVAIIAVLVAIAIPTFNSSLNKAKVATDTANMRAGYAAVMLEIINETPADGKTWTLKTDGTVSDNGTAYVTQGKNDDSNLTVGGLKVGTDGKWSAGQTVTYTYQNAKDGLKITTAAKSDS